MPRSADQIPSEAEVLTYFDKVSNWGRWGKDDQRGTLNLITPQKRVQAAMLVKSGLTVSCSRPITTEKGPDVTSQFQHYMTSTGEAIARQKSEPGRSQGTGDYYGFAYHGLSYTHLDALSHVFWNGTMYNDRSAGLVTAREFAKECDVEQVHDGIVTRGVLLDIPKLRGLPWLDPDAAIFSEDLEAAEKLHNVHVEEGDALLVRTGAWERRQSVGPVASPRPGLHAECMPWLHKRGVAHIVSDSGNDVAPSGYPTVTTPTHQIGFTMMGLWCLDFANFADLAKTCQSQGRYEFMFVVAPLRVQGGTGSPVNPLAIF